MDAKNWRPITFGTVWEHFERVSLFQLRKMDNINTDNDASVADKSGLMAVLSVMDYIKKARDKYKEVRKRGYRIIALVMAEDISSEFESIDYDLMHEILKETFAEEGDFNIR